MNPLFLKVALVCWDPPDVPDFVQEELADAGVELVKVQCQSPEEAQPLPTMPIWCGTWVAART